MASMKKFTICFAFVYYSILFKCWLFIQYKPLNKSIIIVLCLENMSFQNLFLRLIVRWEAPAPALNSDKIGEGIRKVVYFRQHIASGKTPFMCREPRVRRSVIIEFPGIKLDDLSFFSLTIINRYTRQRNPNHCNEFRLPCARNGPSTSIL